MSATEGRSVQQLAEVLASLGASSTESAAQQGAVERIAECFEAEVGVLIRNGVVVASVGFRANAAIPDGLVALVASDGGSIDIPGAGSCTAVVVPVPADDEFHLLIARSGTEAFSLEEVSLLRSLGRILATALDMLQLRDAVASSEAQFRRIVETASEGIWLMTSEGDTVFANDKMAEILGFTTDEMANVSLFDVVDEEGRAYATQNLERRRQGLSDQLECAFVRKDGTHVWTLLHASPVRDAEGDVVGSLCMLSDISERRRIEAVLLQREQQLAEAQRVAGLGSFEYDLVDRTASWSDGLYRILGLDAAAVDPDMGAFIAFIHADDFRAVQQRVRLSLAGQAVDEIEYRIVRRGGDVIWVRARSEVLRDDNGQPILFRGTLLDVTGSKLVEDALRAATARLRLLEAMATAANEASGLDEILDVATQEISAHTGWVAGHAYVPASPDCNRIRPVARWYVADPDWLETLEDALEPTPCDAPAGVLGQVLSTRRSAWTDQLDAQARTPVEHAAATLGCRGSFAFPVCVGAHVTCVLEFFSSEPVAPNAALLDTITQVANQLSRVAERQRANKELATARDAAMESSRLKSDFLATMSHEIRTPMNGVIGLTGLLLATDLDERQLQYAEGVESAGVALLAIINDILDLSKIEAGRLELEEDDFDLVQVVEEAVGLVSQSAHRKGLQLVAHLAPDLPTTVRGDPARLRQILLNLASNAVKFTSQGEVVVRARLLNAGDEMVTVQFEVADTGIGITESAHARLFEPFEQADASTTRKYGGTGLGLAISRRLVTAMGGELGFESTPEQGSTFWFNVPLQPQPLAPALPPERLPNLRVLVADENESVRTALRDRLESWGAHCDVAASATDALRILRAGPRNGTRHDVVLVDASMRGRNGAALVHEIAAEPTVGSSRIVVLTSDAFGVRTEPRHPRVSAYLAKPVRVAQLRDALVVGPPVASIRPWSRRDARSEIRGRVLVVEDNATNQLVAVGILRFLGYSSDVAANGYEALEAMARTEYVAVLMDCQMPEMDGYTATGEIRRIEGASRRTPVIAMTAGATDADRERCLSAGMDDYVPKPVKVEHVEAVLTRWTAARVSATTACG